MSQYPDIFDFPETTIEVDRKKYKARLARLCIEAPAKPEQIKVNIDKEETAKDRYFKVAQALFQDYVQRLDKDAEFPLVSNGSFNGCNVVTLMLRYAAGAYVDFCKGEGQALSLTNMVSALKESKALPHFFAGMDAGKNSLYEKEFGLNSNFDSTFNNLPPFVFTNTDKGHRYEPNPDILEQKFGNPVIYRITPVESFEFCPTRGAFLTETWNTAIDICANHPALFAHDLLVNNSVQ